MIDGCSLRTRDCRHPAGCWSSKIPGCGSREFYVRKGWAPHCGLRSQHQQPPLADRWCPMLPDIARFRDWTCSRWFDPESLMKFAVYLWWVSPLRILSCLDLRLVSPPQQKYPHNREHIFRHNQTCFESYATDSPAVLPGSPGLISSVHFTRATKGLLSIAEAAGQQPSLR